MKEVTCPDKLLLTLNPESANQNYGRCIALDKALFSTKEYLYFSIFLIKNVCCGYSLDEPYRGTSNEYPQQMFSSRNKKTIYLIHPLNKNNEMT